MESISQETLITAATVAATVAIAMTASPFIAGAIIPTLQASLGTVVAGVGTIQAPIIAPLMGFAANGLAVTTTALTTTVAGLSAGI
jgi:hypothetical protein